MFGIFAVRQRLPMFMREVASDTEVTRKMKRAANSIDKFRYIVVFPDSLTKLHNMQISNSF